MVIPEVYAVGTAMEAESAYKGVEAGGGISYDAAYDKGDYVVAVGTGHGFYVLAHEATAFIYVRGVAAFLAFICGFLCGDEPAFTQGLGCGLLAHCYLLDAGSMLNACCSYWVLAVC